MSIGGKQKDAWCKHKEKGEEKACHIESLPPLLASNGPSLPIYLPGRWDREHKINIFIWKGQNWWSANQVNAHSIDTLENLGLFSSCWIALTSLNISDFFLACFVCGLQEACFVLKGNGVGVDLGEKGGGEELGLIEGGETVREESTFN